jgi:hypothetical protein
MRILLERGPVDLVHVVEVPGQVQAGPHSDRLLVHAQSFVSPNPDGHFLFEWDDAAQALRADAAHAFAVAQKTIDMVEQAVSREVSWSWGDGEPLLLAPHRKPPGTTQYVRSQRAATFSRPQDDAEDPDSRQFFECRSMEVVAHEVGHALLDGLRPEWWVGETAVETRAVHEAWADLTGLFLALSFDSLIESALDHNGDLKDENTFAVFGDHRQFTSVATGVRRLDQAWTVQDALNTRTPTGLVDAHAVSRLLSSTVYDVLVKRFEALKEVSTDPVRALRHTADVLRPCALRAIADAERPTLELVLLGFSDNATVMEGADLRDTIMDAARGRGLA